MNAEISVIATCVEATIFLLLYDLHDYCMTVPLSIQSVSNNKFQK